MPQKCIKHYFQNVHGVKCNMANILRVSHISQTYLTRLLEIVPPPTTTHHHPPPPTTYHHHPLPPEINRPLTNMNPSTPTITQNKPSTKQNKRTTTHHQPPPPTTTQNITTTTYYTLKLPTINNHHPK